MIVIGGKMVKYMCKFLYFRFYFTTKNERGERARDDASEDGVSVFSFITRRPRAMRCSLFIQVQIKNKL